MIVRSSSVDASHIFASISILSCVDRAVKNLCEAQ